MKRQRAKLTSITPIFIETVATQSGYQCVDLGYQDIPAMAALQLRCGSENVVPRDAAYYSAHFASGNGAIGIFDDKGVLVAHSLTREAHGNSTAFNVLVDPEHRGQRLHTRMIDKWLEDATRKGLQTVSARVRVDNHVSLKNFEAAGMARVTEEPSPDAPEHMTYWLQKSLRPAYTTSYVSEFRPLVLM